VVFDPTDAHKAAIKQAGFEARDQNRERRITVVGVCKFHKLDPERLPNPLICECDPYYVTIEKATLKVYLK
jgi:hypothetical protein